MVPLSSSHRNSSNRPNSTKSLDKRPTLTNRPGSVHFDSTNSTFGSLRTNPNPLSHHNSTPHETGTTTSSMDLHLPAPPVPPHQAKRTPLSFASHHESQLQLRDTKKIGHQNRKGFVHHVRTISDSGLKRSPMPIKANTIDGCGNHNGLSSLYCKGSCVADRASDARIEEHRLRNDHHSYHFDRLESSHYTPSYPIHMKEEDSVRGHLPHLSLKHTDDMSSLEANAIIPTSPLPPPPQYAARSAQTVGNMNLEQPPIIQYPSLQRSSITSSTLSRPTSKLYAESNASNSNHPSTNQLNRKQHVFGDSMQIRSAQSIESLPSLSSDELSAKYSPVPVPPPRKV